MFVIWGFAILGGTILGSVSYRSYYLGVYFRGLLYPCTPPCKTQGER